MFNPTKQNEIFMQQLNSLDYFFYKKNWIAMVTVSQIQFSNVSYPGVKQFKMMEALPSSNAVTTSITQITWRDKKRPLRAGKFLLYNPLYFFPLF